MKKKKNIETELTLAGKIILGLFFVGHFVPRPFESKGGYFKRVYLGKGENASIFTAYKVMKRLHERGYVKIIKEKSKIVNCILTEKGKLEALFIKAKLGSERKNVWDGKWRLVVFDIPESAREQRDRFRKLLKVNGFKLLQASVFVNPYPLNREAIIYLDQTNLSQYIRIMRVDEMDNERHLLKWFGLSRK